MTFIPAAGCYRVAMEFLNTDGIVGVNVYNCTHGTGEFSANADAINTVFSEWYATHLQLYITANWAWHNLQVRDISVADGEVINFNPGAGMSGLDADTPDANGAAMTVTWQTGFAGKSKRGRTYVLGVAATHRNTTDYLTAIITPMQTVFDSLLSAMTDNDSRLQVVSYRHDNAPRVSALVTEIISARVNTKVYRQWKRMTAP